jgi:hypothetical protein
MDRYALVRRLAPINRLAPDVQETTAAVAQILTLPKGGVLFAQGQQDNYVNYLLGGRVEFLWQDVPIKGFDAGQTRPGPSALRCAPNPKPLSHGSSVTSWNVASSWRASRRLRASCR